MRNMQGALLLILDSRILMAVAISGMQDLHAWSLQAQNEPFVASPGSDSEIEDPASRKCEPVSEIDCTICSCCGFFFVVTMGAAVAMRECGPELQETLLRYETAAGDYSDWSSEMSDSESGSSSFSSTVINSDAALDEPGVLNRTYGVVDSSLESRQTSVTLDEQLDALLAVRLDGTTRNKERMTTDVDVYHCIATLERQVEDLTAELLDVDASLSSAQTRPDDELYYCEAQWTASCHRGEPWVDVVKRHGLLEVRTVCANRPGLLVDIMKAIESTGLTILHTSIARHDEVVIEYLNLELNEETQEVEGEDERVKTMLLRAIHLSSSNWLSSATTL